MFSAAQRIQSSLSKCATAGWGTEAIASKVISVWREIDAALAPIIGHRGVAALFDRSIHLTRADYPWLAASHEGVTDPIDFAAMRSMLSQQTGANVVAANGALLQKFLEQLTSLIGVSLTERLLGPVIDIHSTGDAAQETSP